jgi:1-acyl-sn-glycerol-3-phosphate acyltransferase
VRCQIIGRENIPKVPYVILSKHQSAWETIAFNWLFFPPCFVLKKELINIPVFGWGLAMAGSIAIDRAAGSKAMKKVITKGKERLDQGFNVIIFPEGTRVPPGQTRPFQRGGAILASEMGVPIIPVAHNAGEFLPKGVKLKKTGTVMVSIGAPIDPRGKKASQMNAEVESWIAQETQKITDPAYFTANSNVEA